MYEAITRERVYKKGTFPIEAVRTLVCNVNSKIDTRLTVKFIEIVESVASGFHIPAKLELLTLLQAVGQTNSANVKAYALIIEKDVGLASSILKTVNSPLFGLNTNIRNI
jgi:HD-like signal output (HDOD) protein